MKRDMNLIRLLLLETEGEDLKPDLSAYTEERHVYHSALLIEAGLLHGEVIPDATGQPTETATLRLTWAGHEFLDAARNDTIWHNAGERIKKSGVNVTFTLLSEVLKQLLKQHLGFAPDDWATFAAALRTLAEATSVAKSMESPHGTKYVLDGRLKTPSGKSPVVRTIWIVDRGQAAPRLVTAYPHEQSGSNMIKEHERVVLTAAVPAEGLEAGDVGTVVHIYRDGLAYEVEFTTLAGKTAAVVALEASHVRPVGKREITHARELQAA